MHRNREHCQTLIPQRFATQKARTVVLRQNKSFYYNFFKIGYPIVLKNLLKILRLIVHRLVSSTAKSEHRKFLTKYRKIFENFHHAPISPPIVSKDAQSKVTCACKFWKQSDVKFRKNNNNNSIFTVWKRFAHFALLSVAQAMHWCVLPFIQKLINWTKHWVKNILVLIMSLVDIRLESWKWQKIDRNDFFCYYY